MAAPAIRADLAAALRYTPATQSAVRRSQYLANALQALSADGGKITGGYGELGAKLLAQAILQRGSRKADDQVVQALRGEQDAETGRLLASLGGSKSPNAPAYAAAPPVEPPAPAAVAPPAPQPQPAAQAQPDPTKARLLAQLAWHEARGEPAGGQAAVASVALNRAQQSGQPLDQVVFAPHQFSGFTPQRAASIPEGELAPIMANIAPALAGQDPTGGADHFYNPSLANPSWGRGQGQMIGQHKFMHLGYGGGHQAPDPALAAGASPFEPPPPPPPADPNGPPVQNVGFTPSAPVSSPPAAGSAAAGMLPRANPAAAGPEWPTWKPSDAERAWVAGLLQDPRTFEQGRVEAMKMQQRMTQPVEATVQLINGVPFYVPKEPTPGAAPVMIPVPQEARTQLQTAQSAGIPTAPNGLYVQRDPLGNVKEAPGGPPSGYEAAGGGGLQPQRGGPADPTRPQLPAQGYGYAAGGGQAPIQGGPADPRNPTNVMEGANRYGGMVKSIVDSAMKVRQNFGAVQTGYKQQNGPGDIAMTNGIQKLIDEGVVKGEDVNMQMKSNGLQGTLGGWAQYAQSGGLFTPEVRQKILKTATDLYNNLDQTYRVRVQSLSPGFDEIYGQGAFGKYVFPDAFAQELGWTGEAAPRPSPVEAPAGGPRPLSGAQAQAWNRLVQRGQINTKAPLGDAANPFRPGDEATLKAYDKPQYRGKHILTPSGELVVVE